MRSFIVRTISISFAMLVLTTASFSQSAENPVRTDPSPHATPTPTPPNILYTGKLIGYFRMPNLQPWTLRGCRVSEKDYAEGVAEFLNKRKANPNAILVGTGDNFAPVLEARMFSPPLSGKSYAIDNKELYSWDRDTNSWVYYTDIKEGSPLEKRLAGGMGTVPADNVGCFLAASRYSALVPGKHDFYFGAERVRQLARFMAGLKTSDFDEKLNLKDFVPPQMLGANLVIKTEPFEKTEPAKRAPWFRIDNPENLSFINLEDGKTVYPWLPYVQVKIAQLDRNEPAIGDLETWFKQHSGTATSDALKDYLDRTPAFKAENLTKFVKAVKEFPYDSFSLCPSDGGPDDLKNPHPNKPNLANENNPCKPLRSDIRFVRRTVIYYLALDPRFPNSAADFSPLEPAKNYGLCRIDPTLGPDKPKDFCVRFSVYTPFFTSPSAPSPDKQYVDPAPFVLIQSKPPERPFEVAIFGVVDPNLPEQVGVLNFSWLNENRQMKSVVRAEDPAEALREQLDYFDSQWPHFSGLKILLAQMSPQRARTLAARLPEFQVVVSATDRDQATGSITQSIHWTPDVNDGSFLAVPRPAFDTEQRNVVVDLPGIAASYHQPEWTLEAQRTNPEPVRAKPSAGPDPKDLFKSRLSTSLSQCLPSQAKPDGPTQDQLKWMTLCTMRQRTGADVALLQKRDFFFDDLKTVHDQEIEFQRLLDRVIWKGDLLTLLYLPGSALKKALAQSRKYDTDDANFLSLEDERQRGLEYIGIARVGGEYLINEAPIEDKTIYTVATSDYVGAGDTGYPDLAAMALDPKRYPPEFPSKLEPISSVVCRRLFSRREANLPCLPQLRRDKYLDESNVKATNPGPAAGLESKLLSLIPFRWPAKTPTEKALRGGIQQNAQQHPVWRLSLKNFSLGFDGLTKNLTDAQVSQKFAGIPLSDVTTPKNSSVTAQIATRLSRTSHANEFFVEVGADFKQRSTGDVAPQILQMKNRGIGEVGLIQNIRGGRSATRVGVAMYVHVEAPLQKPFSTFNLGGPERLRITQDRNFLLLPRIGLKWQHRGNSFEGGVEAGREVNAFVGYSFNTNGSVVSCTPNPAETFAACVNRLIKAGTVTKNSVASAIPENRPRAGLYSRLNLTVPFTDKVKYVLSEEGDFFFNFHGDNSIDTRLRDISKHSLKFTIWPSFSIGPSLQILLYTNKVNGDFLFQRQFGFETTLSFDLFNRREKLVQIKHKP